MAKNEVLAATATFNFQLRAMKEYLDILEVRAKIEGINLE